MKKLIRFVIGIIIAPVLLLLAAVTAGYEYLSDEPDWEYWREYWSIFNWILWR